MQPITEGTFFAKKPEVETEGIKVETELEDLEAYSLWATGSVALFEHSEMTADFGPEAANDDAYENLYPFIG